MHILCSGTVSFSDASVMGHEVRAASLLATGGLVILSLVSADATLDRIDRVRLIELRCGLEGGGRRADFLFELLRERLHLREEGL
jgi:hypothetical protein